MCGICGFTGKHNLKLLKEMCNTLFSRGPDGEGFYSDEKINLGVRRLSIVDVQYGKQPVYNEEGNIVLVFNGEIYNHLELRKKLEEKGHKFRSHHSDTEVIVHLYEEFGEKWVKWVNGMFAVAIWDRRNKKLLLYRDRIGIKPLYYSVLKKQIIFASEIKAILAHPVVSGEFNFSALHHYFDLKNISAPSTAYKDIRQLLPANYLIYQAGNIEIKSYWELDFSETLNGISEQEAAQHIMKIFEDSVKLRMKCDVPYGAYLSGGVDSSAVTVFMRRNQKWPVKTFSLVYTDKLEGDFFGKSTDTKYAQQMSRYLGTEHYEYEMRASEVPNSLPKIMQSFDEPFSGTISTYFLSILINKHVKVALSGDGSDELFGSYLTHRLSWPIHNYLKLRKKGKAELAQMSEKEKKILYPFNTREKLQFLKSIANPDISKWRSSLHVFRSNEKKNLFSKKFLDLSGEVNDTKIYKKLREQATAIDPLNLSLEYDQKQLLPDQILSFVDRLSMAHSIEVRVPFLDHRLVEFVAKLPGKMKIKNGINKYIWKQAVKGILPKKIIERPKEGFVLPVFKWIDGELKTYIERVLSPGRISQHGFWNKGYVIELLKEHHSNKIKHSAKLWNLVCFQIWWETLL